MSNGAGDVRTIFEKALCDATRLTLVTFGSHGACAFVIEDVETVTSVNRLFVPRQAPEQIGAKGRLKLTVKAGAASNLKLRWCA